MNHKAIPNIKTVMLTHTQVGNARRYVWACATKYAHCVNTPVKVNEYIRPATKAIQSMNFSVDAIIAYG